MDVRVQNGSPLTVVRSGTNVVIGMRQIDEPIKTPLIIVTVQNVDTGFGGVYRGLYTANPQFGIVTPGFMAGASFVGAKDCLLWNLNELTGYFIGNSLLTTAGIQPYGVFGGQAAITDDEPPQPVFIIDGYANACATDDPES